MTEQELRDEIGGYASVGNVDSIMQLAKAYAAAQMAEKDAEIARLKAENANLQDWITQHVKTKKALKAENERLREGIDLLREKSNGINVEMQVISDGLFALLCDSPAPENPEEKPAPEMIDERPIIYRYKPDMAALGLSEQQAMHHDMAEEYAVVDCDLANAGIVVYAKWRGKWEANPWATRFLVRHLIESLGIKINPIKAR